MSLPRLTGVEDSTNQFIKLSDEMVLYILQWLSVKDLSNAARSNQRLNLLTHDRTSRLAKYKEHCTAYALGNLYILFKKIPNLHPLEVQYAGYIFRVIDDNDFKPILRDPISQISHDYLRALYTIGIGEKTFNELSKAINVGISELCVVLRKLKIEHLPSMIENEYNKIADTQALTIVYKASKLKSAD